MFVGFLPFFKTPIYNDKNNSNNNQGYKYVINYRYFMNLLFKNYYNRYVIHVHRIFHWEPTMLGIPFMETSTFLTKAMSRLRKDIGVLLCDSSRLRPWFSVCWGLAMPSGLALPLFWLHCAGAVMESSLSLGRHNLTCVPSHFCIYLINK